MPKASPVRIGIVAIPIILFLGLFWNHYGFSGSKTVHYTVGDSSPFIQSPLPGDRITPPTFQRKLLGGGSKLSSIELIDQPVYFSVFAPPGNWQTADLKLSFKTGSHAVLELGVLKDLFAQAYDFRPLANTVIENLETHGWVKKSLPTLGENISVFSRQELSGNSPAIDDSEVAVYRASLPWSPPKGPTTAKKDHVYALPLQGPHELFTAIGEGEALKIAVKLHDTNQAAGTDEGAVRVYSSSGEMVGEALFADDGDSSTNGVVSAERSVVVEGDGLPAGVYRMVLSTTSDVVFSEFVTKQNYLVIKNSFRLAAHDGPIAFNTNTKRVTIQPLAADGLGAAVFGKSEVVLEEVQDKYIAVSTDRDVSALIVPGSVRVTGEGFYALADTSLFVPEPAGFSNFLAAPEAYKILVAYSVPEQREGNWRVAESTFELNTLAKEGGAYKFVFSVPRVHDPDGEVEIHAVEMTFKKPPLTVRSFLSSIKSFLKDIIW